MQSHFDVHPLHLHSRILSQQHPHSIKERVKKKRKIDRKNDLFNLTMRVVSNGAITVRYTRIQSMKRRRWLVSALVSGSGVVRGIKKFRYFFLKRFTFLNVNFSKNTKTFVMDDKMVKHHWVR